MDKDKTKLAPLHMAKTLTELNDQVTPPGSILYANSKPRLLLNTAERLFSEGDIVYRMEKDEEKSYVLFMRYIEAVKTIRNQKCAHFDPQVEKLVNRTNLKTALDRCEELSASLKKRYTFSQELAEKEKESQAKEYLDAVENEKRRNEPKLPKTSTVNGILAKSKESEEQHDITPLELKNLIEQKCSRILIVDCRFSSDFTSSHPQHPNCISIPSEILVRGLSAQKISDKLKTSSPEAHILWSTRQDFDFIILYDWNTSFEGRDPVSPISVLYDAISMWDPSTKYKGKILILRGGIRNLYYSYPALLTNPGSFKDETVIKKPDQPLSFDSISYPNMDGTVPVVHRKSPSPIPKLPINSFSRIENQLGKETVPSVTPLPISMEVDRSSKPVRKLPITPSVNNSATDISVRESVVTPANKPDIPPETGLANGHVSKTIDVPGTNGISNGYASHANGIGDSPDSDSGDNLKDGPVLTGLSKSLDSSILAPLRPSQPKPSANGPSSAHPSLSSTGTGRPASQDASATGIYKEKLKDETSEPRTGGLLKRSHSHPNLAQQSFENEESDGTGLQEIPSFSRNLKPATVRPHASETYGARRREFQVVSSTERQKTGLKNLGNTCYMNSIMQCINHTAQLVEYFLQETYKDDCRGSGPTRGEATEEVAAAIKEMNFGHRSIALNDLKSVIGKFHKSFRGTDQQDSHEFLTILLDWMHEELNKVKTKVPLKEQKNDGLSDDEAARIVWKDYLSSNNSKISQLFCGEQKSCVRCQLCFKESVTFEPFFILSVPIPSPSKKCTISQCVDLYTTEEEISGWNCVYCKRSGNAKKKIDLWRLPPYLIIHFQRFYYDGWWKKRLTEVEFPVDRLDLTGKVKGLRNGLSRNGYNFQLYGISNHYGTMDGGHYTAYCRKSNNNWFKYDDHEVSQLSSRDVCTSAAYILFYQNQTW